MLSYAAGVELWKFEVAWIFEKIVLLPLVRVPFAKSVNIVTGPPRYMFSLLIAT